MIQVHDSRMSIVACILCAGGLGHAIELSCLDLLFNREVEGGRNKDPPAMPHVRVNNTHYIYHTYTHTRLICMQETH